MALKKWLRNQLGRDEKEIFNDNVEETEKQFGSLTTQLTAVKERINNLVLGSGGSSPNEVVDARTDEKGNSYPTIKGRIDAGIAAVVASVEQLTQGQGTNASALNVLSNRLSLLYSADGGSKNIYVSSAVGNDVTGDGSQSKPYKTIQRAVNTIPLISTVEYFIELEPGIYLEDVVIKDIQSKSLYVRGTNQATVIAKNGSTGVFVRSISFRDCQAYCAVVGLTQTDAANSQNFIVSGELGWISFDRCQYGVVNNCRADENTKALVYAAVYYSVTPGRTYGSHLANQYFAFRANFMAQVELDSTNAGTGNNFVITCARATVYASGVAVTGTTKINKYAAGQVYE